MSGVLAGAAHFLCRNFAVSHDLRSGFGIFCGGFNQLCNVFKILIELCCGHCIQVLTSFRKRFSPLPYIHIVHHFDLLVNHFDKLF